MKTIEYDPNSYNTALDELVIALRAGEEINIIPVDPYRELRRAQDEGKILQYEKFDEWVDIPMSDKYVLFTKPPECYRIKPDTVKMWQWVYRSQQGRVRNTAEFLRSQEEAAELYPHVTLLQRADWTEISVEVGQ